MKKQTLKDWIKKWSVAEIVGRLVMLGMEFQASHEITSEEVGKIKQIYTRELNSRIKK